MHHRSDTQKYTSVYYSLSIFFLNSSSLTDAGRRKTVLNSSSLKMLCVSSLCGSYSVLQDAPHSLLCLCSLSATGTPGGEVSGLASAGGRGLPTRLLVTNLIHCCNGHLAEVCAEHRQITQWLLSGRWLFSPASATWTSSFGLLTAASCRGIIMPPHNGESLRLHTMTANPQFSATFSVCQRPVEALGSLLASGRKCSSGMSAAFPDVGGR